MKQNVLALFVTMGVVSFNASANEGKASGAELNKVPVEAKMNVKLLDDTAAKLKKTAVMSGECTDTDRSELQQAGYTTCSIQEICGGKQSYFNNLVFMNASDKKTLKNFLEKIGCRDVVLKDLKQSSPIGDHFEAISKNCEVIPKGGTCKYKKNSIPLEYSEEFRASPLAAFELCTYDMEYTKKSVKEKKSEQTPATH